MKGKKRSRSGLVDTQARGPQSDPTPGRCRSSKRRSAFLLAFHSVTKMDYKAGLPSRKVRRSMARSLAKRRAADQRRAA